jgi:hypothetical protein
VSCAYYDGGKPPFRNSFETRCLPATVLEAFGRPLACPQEMLRRLCFMVCCCAMALAQSVPAALAQAPMPDQHSDQTIYGWTVKSDANAFFGYNYQHRKFRDFSAWESQNWFMLAADRRFASGHVIVHGMASLEPFTLRDLGSPTRGW